MTEAFHVAFILDMDLYHNGKRRNKPTTPERIMENGKQTK